jgi:hypothetical protein
LYSTRFKRDEVWAAKEWVLKALRAGYEVLYRSGTMWLGK